MRQLSQRVTARYHLDPISREEAGAYIRHRLQICGTTQPVFSKRSVDRIQQLSGGIPRLINVLCDRSMLGAYVEGKVQVDPKVVKKAAREVLAEDDDSGEQGGGLKWAMAALLLLLIIGLAVVLQPWQQTETTASVPAAEAEKPAEIITQAVTVCGAVNRCLTMSFRMNHGHSHWRSSGLNEPEPEPESPTLAALLLETDKANYRAAWTELFSLWSVELPASVKPDFCDFAKQYGLLCMLEQGNWNTLRQFNRPVILTAGYRGWPAGAGGVAVSG